MDKRLEKETNNKTIENKEKDITKNEIIKRVEKIEDEKFLKVVLSLIKSYRN